MSLRFTIGRKLGLGFGSLIVFIVVVFILTYNTFTTSKKQTDDIANIYRPSVARLGELRYEIVRSRLLTMTWINIPQEEAKDKQKLNSLHYREYPHLKTKLLDLSAQWTDEEDQQTIKKTFLHIDKLFAMQEDVKDVLADFEDYKDPSNLWMTGARLEEDGDIYEKYQEIMLSLNDLINRQQHETDQRTEKMFESFDFLKMLITIFMIALPIAGLLVAFFTTRSIVRPVGKLKGVLFDLSKGVYPEETVRARNDEIGEMTNALNRLVAALKRTKDFANEVGAGNFETDYEPLGEQDSLGKALLKMRDDLAENERELERKVEERTAEVVRQKEEIEIQNQRISELYNQVTDSIKYAKRIQEAILPPDELVKRMFPESFILYKPKDIVSGDFYWIGKKNGKSYFAAVDCTGHGVPGALMSIVGSNGLNQALSAASSDNPAHVLDELNKTVTETLHKRDESAAQDGMDIAICALSEDGKTLEYAGAYNPLYLLRDGEIQQIKADKQAIGSFSDKSAPYTNHEIKLESGDYVYLFSDGYADQFGGPQGKKFMYKQFRKELSALQGMSMDEQRDLLDNTIEKWKGPLEQVDDILIMGLKIA